MASPQVPPGVNLADDQRPNIIVGVSIISAVSGLALAARLASMQINKMGITLSDVFVILGMTFSWVDSALTIFSTTLGLGLHIERVAETDPSLSNVEEFLFTTIFQEIFYTLSLVCTKISILLLYRRIFNNAFQFTSYAIMTLVVMWGIAVVLVSIFSCTPIDGFWHPNMQPPPRCINSRDFYIGNSVPNILADIAIISLPIRRVWKLQMRTKSKFAVCGLFLLGGFVIVASAIRLANLLSVTTADATWGFVEISLWSCVEMNVAVTSACLPTVRPLLSKIPMCFSRNRSPTTGRILWSKNPYEGVREERGTDAEELSRLPKVDPFSVSSVNEGVSYRSDIESTK